MIVKDPTCAVECTHCGLPVPRGLIEHGSDTQFCCNGCAGAYQLIHANGLDSFYQMTTANRADLTLKNRQGMSDRFAEFDSQLFFAKFVQPLNANESQIQLALDGIHCGACIWLIEKLPSILPGVIDAQVNWSRGTVRVRWQTDSLPLSQIAGTLARLGYLPHPIRENEREQRVKKENRRHLAQIGIAAALAGNNMMISAAIYLGMFSHMSTDMNQLLRIASCLIGVFALLVPGRVFLASAVNAIRTRTPHMDLPIALALLGGTLVGTANVIRGVGEIYFDSLSVLIFLLLIGRWIQFRQQARAADSIDMLYQLTPRTANKIVDGEPVKTFVDLVEVGDQLLVRPGELIPVDGDIVDGSTHLDEAILTGESVQVTKCIGDRIAAGSTNLSGVITMVATQVGTQTRISKIVELVEEASLSKPRVVQWANRIGGYFVGLVILLASITFVYWLPTQLETAVDRSIALLIVACPCALALATPLALAVAIGRAAHNKIMIKGGDVLQTLQKPGTIWLDKTGTLTEGELNVVRWYGSTSKLAQILELEKHSSHPVAKAIVRFAEEKLVAYKSRTNPLTKATEIQGIGMIGQVDGHQIQLGNQQLLQKLGITPPQRQQRIANHIIEQGNSVCWVVIDGTIAAIVALGDTIRKDAVASIDRLKQGGWKVGILSGDHQRIVDAVAKHLDIDPGMAIGNAPPEKKLSIVQKSAGDETVVMIGDGVNDSAALAAATVGVTVKNGAEASLAAAPVYLAKPGLQPLIELMKISKTTNSTMRGNLAVSLGYNATFAALAFLGFINPLVAAILMPISSLTVVSLSLRAGRSGAKEELETTNMDAQTFRLARG